MYFVYVDYISRPTTITAISVSSLQIQSAYLSGWNGSRNNSNSIGSIFPAENAKWRGKTAVNSIFNVDQTKCFMIFINSKVVGEYKTICKDFYFVHYINNLSGEYFLTDPSTVFLMGCSVLPGLRNWFGKTALFDYGSRDHAWKY